MWKMVHVSRTLPCVMFWCAKANKQHMHITSYRTSDNYIESTFNCLIIMTCRFSQQKIVGFCWNSIHFRSFWIFVKNRTFQFETNYCWKAVHHFSYIFINWFYKCRTVAVNNSYRRHRSKWLGKNLKNACACLRIHFTWFFTVHYLCSWIIMCRQLTILTQFTQCIGTHQCLLYINCDACTLIPQH